MESDHLFVAIKTIENKVDRMNASIEWLLKVNGEGLKEAIIKLLDDDANLKIVYLEVDGLKSGVDIVKSLEKHNINISQPTISRKLTILEKMGLIEVVDFSKGKIYKKSSIDKILDISATLG